MSTQFETIYITLYATKNGKNIKQIPWQLVVGIEQNIFVPRITTSHIYGHFHSNLGLLLNILRKIQPIVSISFISKIKMNSCKKYNFQ